MKTVQHAAFLLALSAGLTGFARIVHTPASAIASGTNPATVNGATWSFHRRVWWNCPNTEPSGFVVESRDNGLVGFKTGDNVILVNTTSHSVDDPVISASNQSGYIPIDPVAPGEVIMHPNPHSETDPNRTALRFTVPRTGRYSLSVVFRSLNGKAFKGNKIDISVLIDNTLLFIDELTHPDNSDRKSYAFNSMFLLAGQTIDFVVGSGRAEKNHQGDATALALAIVEEDETFDPIDGTWNLGTALHAEYLKETPEMPFPADAFGASWGFYSVSHVPFFFEYASPALLGGWCADPALSGPRVSQDGVGAAEHVSVYDPAATSSGLTGLGTIQWLDRTAPGEISLHPSSAAQDVDLRFVTPSDGRYVVSYALRDASSGPVGDSAGVDVNVLAGSVCLDVARVSVEVGPHIVFRQVETPPLKAGTAIDVRIYNRGRYNYDGTAGQIRIFKLKDSVPVKGFCAATALRANANGANTNPFTDEKGATWTFGTSLTPECTPFYVMGGTVTSTRMKGWKNTEVATRYAGLPVFYVNPTLDRIENSDDTTIPADQYLFPNEIFLHPSSIRDTLANVFAVLRFAAPQAGVYSLDAVVRDVNSSSLCAAGTGGVVIHVMGPDGTYLASGYACCDRNNTFVWSHLHPGDIYLLAGETIDICVAPKTARRTDCDATALYENINMTDAPEEAFFGVDIRTAAGGATRYAARGRVGFGEQTWSTTRAGDGVITCDNMKSADGVSKTVFTLARQGGAPVAAALGVNALLNDGVVSSGTNSVYTFSFTQLVPNSEYTLYLYGSTVADDGVPTFAVGETAVVPELGWSRPFTNDVAVLSVVSDASGTITGTFHSTGDASAAFCGVQIAGAEFNYQRGMTIILK